MGSSSGSSVHVKLLINDKEVGVLYLKEDEVDILTTALKKGIYSSDIKFETNLYDDSEDFDDDIEYDNE